MERMTLLVIAILTLACLSSVEASSMSIGKMIQWVDPEVSWLISAVKFKNYGCHCREAAGSADVEPLDEIDNCCKVHNACYDTLVESGVCPANTFGQDYDYKKITENRKKTIQCTSDPHTHACAYQLCRCDAEVAQCFAENDKLHYNSHHKNARSCGK